MTLTDKIKQSNIGKEDIRDEIKEALVLLPKVKEMISMKTINDKIKELICVQDFPMNEMYEEHVQLVREVAIWACEELITNTDPNDESQTIRKLLDKLKE